MQGAAGSKFCGKVRSSPEPSRNSLRSIACRQSDRSVGNSNAMMKRHVASRRPRWQDGAVRVVRCGLRQQRSSGRRSHDGPRAQRSAAQSRSMCFASQAKAANQKMGCCQQAPWARKWASAVNDRAVLLRVASAKREYCAGWRGVHGDRSSHVTVQRAGPIDLRWRASPAPSWDPLGCLANACCRDAPCSHAPAAWGGWSLHPPALESAAAHLLHSLRRDTLPPNFCPTKQIVAALAPKFRRYPVACQSLMTMALNQ